MSITGKILNGKFCKLLTLITPLLKFAISSFSVKSRSYKI